MRVRDGAGELEAAALVEFQEDVAEGAGFGAGVHEGGFGGGVVELHAAAGIERDAGLVVFAILAETEVEVACLAFFDGLEVEGHGHSPVMIISGGVGISHRILGGIRKRGEARGSGKQHIRTMHG
jgi:hypothetical protein